MSSGTQTKPHSGAPAESKKLINLLRGWPSPRVLPASFLRDAANKALSDPAVFVPGLQYGPDPGYQPLREALAAWLSSFYHTTAAPDRICVTGGASQSLACLLQSFTDPAYTRRIWAVAPCYFLACPIFYDSGFAGRLRAVPEDEEGIDLEWLRSELRAEEKKGDMPSKPVYKDPGSNRKVYRHIIYVVPTCANPSGKTMTLARREGLVRLAREHDALVICDDVYDFLQWEIAAAPGSLPGATATPLPAGTPLPRLSDVDFALGRSAHDPPGKHFGHAVSNGSFSKLLGPGVRTGWVEGTADIAHGLSQTGSTRSGGAPSQLAAIMITEMMLAGTLDTHISRSVRPALQRRHALLVDAVERHLAPHGVTMRLEGETGKGVYGGYFAWLTLPEDGPDADRVAVTAQLEENLIVAPGSKFEVHGDEDGVRFPRNIRLCFSWEEEDDLVEGIRRLGSVFERLGKGGTAEQTEEEANQVNHDGSAFK